MPGTAVGVTATYNVKGETHHVDHNPRDLGHHRGGFVHPSRQAGLGASVTELHPDDGVDQESELGVDIGTSLMLGAVGAYTGARLHDERS